MSSLSSPPSSLLAAERLTPVPHKDVVVRDSWLAIRALVSQKDLSVVFQPIVDLDTGESFAIEALVRCSVPQYSSPPILFERAALIGCAGRLGRMIREIAVPLAARMPLFINIHPHELNEGWLVRPDDPLYVHDAPVYLEITESVPLTHFELVMSVLKEVKMRGDVKLVVDDLGAGYSNLKSIADLEPNIVKLDRGLISGIDRSSRQHQLVTSVVRLCRELRAKVVVEGVETVDELSALRDTGADFAQGFLFARPSYPIPNATWPPDMLFRDRSGHRQAR
jgi:EAL domain-containing protein (putative c-di-GMP-specific phosphodiesterase class I)